MVLVGLICIILFDEKIYLVNILHENIEYRTIYSELLSEGITVSVVQ